MSETKTKHDQKFDTVFAGFVIGISLLSSAILIASYDDANFNEAVYGAIDIVVPSENGGVIMAGDFSENRIGEITETGEFKVVTDEYGSQFNGHIADLKRLEYGGLLVSGSFTSYGQSLVGYVAKIEENGNLDEDFQRNMGTGFDDRVEKVFQLANGDFIISGRFRSYNGYNADGVAYIKANGEFNTDFEANEGLNGKVLSMAELPGGKILLGGDFTSYRNEAVPYLVTVNMPE